MAQTATHDRPEPIASDRRADATAVLLMLAVVCVFYGRILCGSVLFGSDFFPYMLGEKLLTRAYWLRGQIPGLNPYILCGTPHLANIATASLYPLNVLLLVGSPWWGVHFFIFMHYPLAALGFYLFVRRGLRVSPAVAATAGVAYACGGYLWSMIDHNFFAAAPWTPLYFLGLLATCRDQGQTLRSRMRWCCVCVFAFTLLLYCGNFQQAYDAAVCGGFLAVACAVAHVRRGDRQRVWQCAAAFGGTGVLGVLLAAPQLLPTWLVALHSYRAGGIPLAEAGAWSFPASRLVEYVIPFFYGSRHEILLSADRFYSGTATWSQAVFIGLPLLTAIACVGSWRGKWLRAWLFVVLAVGLLMAFGLQTPLYAVAHSCIPGFSAFRHPEKYLFWVHFSVIGIGALGLHRAGTNRDVARRLGYAAITIATAVLLTGIGAFIWQRARGDAGTMMLCRWRMIHAGVCAVFLTVLAVVARWPARLQDGRSLVRVAFVLTVVHLLMLGCAVRWTMPGEQLHAARPAAELLPESLRSSQRVYSDPVNRAPALGAGRWFEQHHSVAVKTGEYVRMVYNAPSIFGVYTCQGFSALADPAYVDYSDFTRHDPRKIMNLLCVSHLIVPSMAPAAQVPPGNRIVDVDRDDGYTILANDSALPRFYTTNRYVEVPAHTVAQAAFELVPLTRVDAGQNRLDAEFPPIVISALPRHFVANAVPAENPGLILGRNDPGHITCTVSGPIWFVCRDWYVPGWRARMDRTDQVEITRVDGGMMAVFVPVGRHQLVLQYDPPGFMPGCVIAVLAVLGVVVVALRGLRVAAASPGSARRPVPRVDAN